MEKVKSKLAPKNLWGIDLIEYLKELSDDVDWMSHGFLTESSITMLYATDGIGKSLIGIQAALELASGLPVFKAFHTDKPRQVIYCQAERSIKEPTKRIKSMIQDPEYQDKIKFGNFTLTTEFQGRDLSKESEADYLMSILNGHSDVMGGADIVFFDPLYALIRGDLNSNEAINKVFNFFRRVGNELGCSIFFLHHENRGQRELGAKERSGQDYYGSKFISGLCTGVWHMKKEKEDSFITTIANEKDSESCLVPSFKLTYDPEFNTVRANVSSSSKAKDILTQAFLASAKESGRKFTQNDFFTETQIQMHAVNQRKHFGALIKNKKIKNIATSGLEGIYVAF